MTSCSYSVRFFFFKQKTAYEIRISDWSSDVCSSDLLVSHAVSNSQGSADPVGTLLAGHFLDGQRVENLQSQVDGVLRLLPAGEEERTWRYLDTRSEERRVGKECVSTCRNRW